MSGPTITTELSVARVDVGGNTGDGAYFYNFTPSIVNVVAANTMLTYKFRDDIDPRFRIVDIFTTDAKFQIEKVMIAPDYRSISLQVTNTEKQLIIVSLLVIDEKTGLNLNCDPEVICQPPT